MDKQINK